MRQLKRLRKRHGLIHAEVPSLCKPHGSSPNVHRRMGSLKTESAIGRGVPVNPPCHYFFTWCRFYFERPRSSPEIFPGTSSYWSLLRDGAIDTHCREWIYIAVKIIFIPISSFQTVFCHIGSVSVLVLFCANPWFGQYWCILIRL